MTVVIPQDHGRKSDGKIYCIGAAMDSGRAGYGLALLEEGPCRKQFQVFTGSGLGTPRMQYGLRNSI